MDQQSDDGIDHSHDKVFFETFLGVLGVLFGITFLIFIAANMIDDSDAQVANEPVKLERIHDRIKPVGTVVTDAAALQVAAAAPAKARSAEEIVNGVCAGCHASGVLNAPKLGDASAWKPHLKEGREHLYMVAIEGEGAMPPRGGDASLSDDEVKAAVDYILEDAGL